MFFYSVDILSRKTSAHFKEFTNKQYKEFVKVLLNDDKSVIERYVTRLIADLSVDDITPSQLTSLDKLYILLCIRSYNISSKITLNTQTTEKVNITVSVDVNEILQKLEQLEIKHVFDDIVCDGIKITGTLPKDLCGKSALDLVCSSIDNIWIKEKSVEISKLNSSERQSILNNLPVSIISRVTEFIYAQDKELSKDPIFVFDTNKELPFEKEIKLSLLNNSIIELIKVIFNTNLRDFYTTEYVLYKKFNMPYESLNNLTPAEINLYFDVIAKDIEQEKKEMEEQSQPGGIPLAKK